MMWVVTGRSGGLGQWWPKGREKEKKVSPSSFPTRTFSSGYYWEFPNFAYTKNKFVPAPLRYVIYVQIYFSLTTQFQPVLFTARPYLLLLERYPFETNQYRYISYGVRTRIYYTGTSPENRLFIIASFPFSYLRNRQQYAGAMSPPPIAKTFKRRQ